MTPKHFDKWTERLLWRVRTVLESKAAEYSNHDDRLRSFKVNAAEFGGTPSEECWAQLKKHLTALSDLARGIHPPDPAVVWERAGDSMGYIVLLSALLLEDQIAELEDRLSVNSEPSAFPTDVPLFNPPT